MFREIWLVHNTHCRQAELAALKQWVVWGVCRGGRTARKRWCNIIYSWITATSIGLGRAGETKGTLIGWRCSVALAGGGKWVEWRKKYAGWRTTEGVGEVEGNQQLSHLKSLGNSNVGFCCVILFLCGWNAWDCIELLRFGSSRFKLPKTWTVFVKLDRLCIICPIWPFLYFDQFLQFDH